MSLFTPPNVRATDANGNPISGAKWRFTLTGTLTPADVYTTSVRDVPHTNPVEADSGGKFPAIYTNPAVTYRATLLDAADAPIPGFDFDPYITLAADDITYTPPGTGAEPTDIASHTDRGPLYVEAFRATGDTDTAVLAKAFAAWKIRKGRLEAEPGREYDLGTLDSETPVFTINGFEDGIFVGNGCTFHCETDAAIFATIFQIEASHNLTFQNMHGTDDGYMALPSEGARFLVLSGLDTANNGPSTNITFDKITAYRMTSGIQSRGETHLVSQIVLNRNCRFEQVYYPASFNEGGYDVTGGYTCVDCVRVYLPYGFKDHDLDIRVEHGGTETAGQQPILIKAYDNPSENLRLRVTFAGVLAYGSNPTVGALVQIEAQPSSGDRRFDNIELDITIEQGTTNPNNVPALGFLSYDAGDMEDSSAFNAATTNASAVITPAVTLERFKVGQEIVGAGIPDGTTVITIGATTLTLSANATATAAAASLRLRTANRFGNIRLKGDLSALTSPTKIKCGSTPIVPPVLTLDPGLTGLDIDDCDLVNFRIRVAQDREFMMMRGDLTTQKVRIPVSNLSGKAWVARANAVAFDSLAAGAAANMGRKVYSLVGYNVGGTVTNTATAIASLADSQGTAPTFTWGVGTNSIDVQPGGAPYTSANSIFRLEIQWEGGIPG